MKKILNEVAGLLFLHVVSCWPVVAFYHYESLTHWCHDPRVRMIFDCVFAITALCIFFSLLAMVFKAYRTALFFAIIPFIVQLILVCSAMLVFIFHRELTAVLAMGRLRAAGGAIMSVIKAPITLFKKIFLTVS